MRSAALLLLLSIDFASAFSTTTRNSGTFLKSKSKSTFATTTTTTFTTSLCALQENGNVNDGGVAGGPPRLSTEEEQKVQWDLFTKHHAKGEGKWRGDWVSYDYMGDIIDTTTASLNLKLDNESNPPTVTHTHDIVTGSRKADCNTCFDSETVKTLPVGMYSPGNLNKYRCASVGMACGPSLLRSGAMSTELALNHGNGRLRVIFQHAPVWEAGVEPGSCPPQALKLFRTMISREVLDTESPPTRDTEMKNPPKRGDPSFFRPVPPFQWHKKWAGSSWTWGEQTGDRGWSIDDMEEGDAWHGRPTGDTSDVWAMRLPGGILLQAPRIITTGRAGLCRLAWLPEDDAPEGSADDGDTAKLLRIEASVLALEPVIDEENDVMLGFYPPELGSLRCDILAKFGELEDTSMLEKLQKLGEIGVGVDAVDAGDIGPVSEAQIEADKQKAKEERKKQETEMMERAAKAKAASDAAKAKAKEASANGDKTDN
eukprot:CAMPEP_0194108744 /NCGR_PEP_ID=MMETSP0150-20130528/8387_1 /TAXON_ID=122233 /ORGANISM="Chaetoceros debilis, Strain MM31A-1" /LENGTH=484 /DNA_ID=CAMNT_0038797523 /DNA_START=159 /DNA_END=1610 /DNA_ORIENTATION=+